MTITRVLLAMLTLAASTTTVAQNFPARAVQLVLPFAPGGGADTQARIVVQELARIWGQPVVIENRPGAGTTIAAASVAKAPPDGHTLYSAYTSHVISGNLYRNLPYDPLKSFSAITVTTDAPFTLVVQPGFKARTVKELVQLAKANPGQLNYGSSGIGASPHIAGELFKTATDVQATHIPYKGTGDVIPALLGGQFDYTFADPAVRPTVMSGKLRALAVSSSRRWSLMPDIPTMAEAGVPGVEVTSWTIFLAPARTPPAVVRQVNEALLRVLKNSEVQAKFAANGYDIIGNTPEQAGEHLASEFVKYGRVVKQLGLKVE
jgi:tripartite-type tricarboxylate transporter receptor subunit TctC